MKVVITGGAGFIGRATVERLADRGDEVVALVRDLDRAKHLVRPGVRLAINDLKSVAALKAQMQGADAVIHAAGSYRVGIRANERDAMWEANVGATERVLDAAIAAGVKRIVYVSTNGIFGDTHGVQVDETFHRDLSTGFLSWYDETKYLAHDAVLARIAKGAPVVIVQPGQVYGPHDHSLVSTQLDLAHRGRLFYTVLSSSGQSWTHVHDLADGIVAALDRGRLGEAYSMAGESHRLKEAIAIAARVGGRKPPRLSIPTRLLRLIAPLNDRLGGLPGLPDNLGEVIRSGDGVTFWAKHDKATAELGFNPRPLEQGVADTWGRKAAKS